MLIIIIITIVFVVLKSFICIVLSVKKKPLLGAGAYGFYM